MVCAQGKGKLKFKMFKDPSEWRVRVRLISQCLILEVTAWCDTCDDDFLNIEIARNQL